MEKTIKFNGDFKGKKLLLIVLLKDRSYHSCPYTSQIKTITSSEISQQLRLMVQSGFTTATSDGAIRGLNSSCVVVAVSCCITY